MADALLILQGVTLGAEDEAVLFQDFQWTLHRGERIQVVAEGGSGASSLLRLAVGLAHPREGKVLLNGTPLAPHLFEHPFINRGHVGWIPEEKGLIQNMSLLANVALPLAFIKGLAGQKAEAAALEALHSAGLEAFALQRPHLMGPREHWLGALVRASLLKPELWLVDRPKTKLDRRTRTTARKLLAEAAEDPKVTMVIVGEGDWAPDLNWTKLKLDRTGLSPEEPS